MILIGIDIGVTGAIAAVDSRGTCTIHDLETLPVPGASRLVKRRLDGRALIHTLRALIPPGAVAKAVIEDIHMRPGTGGAATSSLSGSRGVVEAVLDIARVDWATVQPRRWKAGLGLIGKSKRDSIDLASSLYPPAVASLKRQRDHNRAEALLLAHWLAQQEGLA